MISHSLKSSIVTEVAFITFPTTSKGDGEEDEEDTIGSYSLPTHSLVSGSAL